MAHVVQCICIIFCLQDFSCTNAGTGSNLTKSGTVECDASIMDGQSLAFGAVGALRGKLNDSLWHFINNTNGPSANILFKKRKDMLNLFGKIFPSLGEARDCFANLLIKSAIKFSIHDKHAP